MAMLSAPLIKMIFDKNPGRELFIEQSYPIKWMRPNLEPHGLIFKLTRPVTPEPSVAGATPFCQVSKCPE